MSGEGVTFFFFPVYYKLINFKLVHSYNVKHLTCTIFSSRGLHKYIQAPYMEVFNIYIAYKRNKNTYTLYQMVLQWAPSDVLTLTADADCLVLWFPLLYLHGCNTHAKLIA